MATTRKAAPAQRQSGVRYDLAWAFARAEFQTPGLILSWWLDSSYSSEPKARHRMLELETFMRAFVGSMALYRVDFRGNEIISERLIHQTGKDPAPKRNVVLPMNQGAASAFRAIATEWLARGNPDILTARPIEAERVRTLARRRKPRGDTGRAATFFFCLTLLTGGLGWAAWTYRPWDQETKTTTSTAGTANPARFDNAMIAVPNREGSCDRMSFNNRTGTMAYAGKIDCDQASAAEPPQPRTAPTKGFASFRNR